MNTKDYTTEYRLTHWAGIMREREESGLSIRAFCENAGFHENRYLYWQKKLREAACEELTKIQNKSTSMASPAFAEVKLPERSTVAQAKDIMQNQVCVEAAGVRITAGGEYPINKLAELLQIVSRVCY